MAAVILTISELGVAAISWLSVSLTLALAVAAARGNT